MSGLLSVSASAQSAVSPATRWSGWARCELAVSGAGYADRQSHFWVLTDAPPTVQGAMQVYAATWSLAGSGSLSESNGRQTRTAQWTTNVPGMAAPIAFTVRASDGRLLIKPWHAQLRSPGAVSGVQQVIIDGVAQRPGVISLEAFEWAFPSLVESAGVERVSGTSTPLVTGKVSPMQPAGAPASASCSWQLARVPAGAKEIVQLPPRERTRFVPIDPRATDAAPEYRWCIRSTTPPLSFDAVRQAIAECITEAAQQVGVNLAQLLTEIRSPPASTPPASPIPTDPSAPPPLPRRCTDIVAEVDAQYSWLIQLVEGEYDRLIRDATNDAERQSVTKEKEGTLRQLREQRDKAVAEAAKACEETRARNG